MRPGVERPIRIRFEHTRFGHWGAHSGYFLFTEHLDPGRFRAERHAAGDNDHDIPSWLVPLKEPIRRFLRRRRMKWYKVSDAHAELAALARCLTGQADIVHFLDGEHSGQFLPRLLRTVGSRVRTVATFHQPADLLDDIVDPAVIRRFDHIVLMSPSQRPYFAGLVDEDRISVILHGVDTEFFHPRIEERAPGPLRCITAGHWLRDWRTFRAVAERMPSVEFHVVTASDTGSEDLQNVRRHRGVDDQTLAELYRAADVLFLPLLDSTANNALLEGIASGLATLTTDLESVRAYLPGDDAIRVPVGDAERAHAALAQLQGDADLRRRLGRAARLRAEALSWPRVAARYEALFTDLLPAARPGG